MGGGGNEIVEFVVGVAWVGDHGVMNHPWGLSGPEFLWLYAGGLLLGLGWAISTRARVRRPRLSEPVPVLDDDGRAFLLGGTARVAETSIARLIASDKVRVSRDGTITATATSDDNPLDEAMLHEIGRRPKQPHLVLGRSYDVPLIAAVEERLAAQGFLVPTADLRRARWRALVVLGLVFVVGVVRLVNGIVEDLPVGYLTALLAVTAVLMIVLLVRHLPRQTVHGDRAVAAAGLDQRQDPARVVSVLGLGAYPDPDIRKALSGGRRRSGQRARTRAYGAAGAGGGVYAACGSGGSSCGGSSSGSSSSGSSGGGSSCGGGGCGGGGA